MSLNLTDEELVNQYLLTRRNDYFEALYSRYCQKVHRKCLSFTKDAERADDLTQDIFLRLIGKLDGYKKQAKFSTWLYSVTHNYCTDQIRTPYQQELLTDDALDELQLNADDDTTEQTEVNAWRVQQALLSLAPEEQLLLRQKYQDDISIRELADLHALSESAVKMRLKRSRDRLRAVYWTLTAE